MLRYQVATIGVVLLLVIGGAAAIGAASPEDPGNASADNVEPPDDPGDGVADQADERESNRSAAAGPPDEPGDAVDNQAEEGEAANRSTEVGPSDELPEHVPEHVSAIHDVIESFLSDSEDHLGEALTELLGVGQASD